LRFGFDALTIPALEPEEQPVTEYRTEKDTMGDVKVPKDAYYGAQTQRAVENFPVSGQRLPRYFVAAIAHLKGACAEVNLALKPARMTPELCKMIQDACARVAEGGLDAEFPIDVFQTGSGTSTNMNANEVIANLCNEKGRRPARRLQADPPERPRQHGPVVERHHPDDVPPRALLAIHRDLKPALDQLATSLEKKAKEFDPIVKLGRTHLMDAVPVRMGQEFGGYAMQVRKGWSRSNGRRRGSRRWPSAARRRARASTRTPSSRSASAPCSRRSWASPVREARDHFEAQGGRDDMAMVSGSLKGLACSLMKIANDIRWMGSGPSAAWPSADPRPAARVVHHARPR